MVAQRDARLRRPPFCAKKRRPIAGFLSVTRARRVIATFARLINEIAAATGGRMKVCVIYACVRVCVRALGAPKSRDN